LGNYCGVVFDFYSRVSCGLQTIFGLNMTSPIFSINSEQSSQVSDLFWKFEAERFRPAANVAAAAAGFAGVVGVAGVAGSASAANVAAGAAGNAQAAFDAAATTIAAGVTNAITMILNVNGIALAAFGVALTPMGFMLTLRLLNMVLSRV
jgi:hypothetical protein